jgi:hypothetical protein
MERLATGEDSEIEKASDRENGEHTHRDGIRVLRLSDEQEQTILAAVSRRMGWDAEGDSEAEGSYFPGVAGAGDDTDDGREIRELNGVSTSSTQEA